MSHKRPLTYEELVKLAENLSDIEYLSGDNNEFTGDTPVEQESDNIEDDVDFGVEHEHETEIETPLIKSEQCTKKIKIANFIKENDLTIKKNIKWKKNVTFLTPEYRWNEKLQSEAVELENPLNFFKLYFTEELFQTMVQYTNLYATQQNSRFAFTSINELHTFIGIHIIMGNLHYPQVRFYWNTSYAIRVPIIADYKAVNRFFAIRNHLHFVDTKTRDPYWSDRFWKVRPLYNTIRARCLSLPLEPELVIDEQIVPFKGRLDVKQYIKNKPNPWGIKIFAICGLSGMLYDFIIYQGATTELVAVEKNVFGLGGAVVSKLCTRIEQVPVKLFFDNCFSNYNVIQYLQNKSIYCTCTTRIDIFRQPPLESDAVMKKRGPGAMEEVINEDGHVIVTKWFDNKPLYMAYSFLGIGQPGRCKRWDKVKKEYIFIQRPEVVRIYNKSMEGVDKLDFMLAINRTFIQSKKWTLRMFTHAIDIACANAWFEYRQKAANLHFRVHIAEALILSNKAPNKKRGHPSTEAKTHLSSSTKTHLSSSKRTQELRPVQEVRYDCLNHWPIHEEKSSLPDVKWINAKVFQE